MDDSQRIKTQATYEMLAWMADWARRSFDEGGPVYYLWAQSTYWFTYDLLVEVGVVKESSEPGYAFISSSIQLNDQIDFERILITFYNLGDFYGYGVKFQEEGFKVSTKIEPLFAKLLRLGYCIKNDGLYFWSQKCFELAFDGFGFWVPSKRELFEREVDKIIQVLNKSRKGEALGALDIDSLTSAFDMGLKMDSSQSEFDKAVLRWWKGELNKPPITWPASIPLEDIYPSAGA